MVHPVVDVHKIWSRVLVSLVPRSNDNGGSDIIGDHKGGKCDVEGGGGGDSEPVHDGVKVDPDFYRGRMLLASHVCHWV